MKPHQLSKISGKKKRLGRGNSGKGGTTAGRGTKGQRSRTSRGNIPSSFEGGQTALKARLPKKRGFHPHVRVEFQVINLRNITAKFKENDLVDKEKLLKANLIKDIKRPVKVLGDGEIDKKMEIKANSFSASAKTKIEKAGGKAVIG